MSAGTSKTMSAVVPSCIGTSRPASSPLPGIRQLPAEARRIGDLFRRHQDRPDGQERVRALGPQPLAVAPLARAQRLFAALPVACRHVIDNDVPGDVPEGVVRSTWLARSPMTTRARPRGRARGCRADGRSGRRWRPPCWRTSRTASDGPGTGCPARRNGLCSSTPRRRPCLVAVPRAPASGRPATAWCRP